MFVGCDDYGVPQNDEFDKKRRRIRMMERFEIILLTVSCGATSDVRSRAEVTCTLVI